MGRNPLIYEIMQLHKLQVERLLDVVSLCCLDIISKCHLRFRLIITMSIVDYVGNFINQFLYCSIDKDKYIVFPAPDNVC